MKGQDILARIEARLAATGISASRASLESGKSRDLIRNWQRARQEGRDFPGNLQQLEALAPVLGVTADFLVRGSDSQGLSDSAEPFTPRPVPQGETLDAYLAPTTQHRMTWRASAAAPGFGILAGDALVIDMKRAPRPGEIVLAAVLALDATETRILRYAPPWLIPDTAGDPAVPESDTRIQGPIVAVARGPGLTST